MTNQQKKRPLQLPQQPEFWSLYHRIHQGRGSGVGGSSAGEQKRDHGHGEGGSSCGERRKYTGRLDVPAKAACKAGEALQSLAWAVELLSFCMDTSGSEPSANGDHAEQCLIHKVRTPRTVFFCLGFTRFNS